MKTEPPNMAGSPTSNLPFVSGPATQMETEPRPDTAGSPLPLL